MAAAGTQLHQQFLLAGASPVDAVEISAWTCLGLPVGRANACFSCFWRDKFSRTPHACRRLGDKPGIKTSATASSYVFLQQELARGLRLSQPSRVAKDAARGELLGCLHDIARQQPHALVDAVDAAPARRSSRDATRDCCSTVCTRESAVAAKRATRDDALTDIV